MKCLTVALVRDPQTGDVDPAAPALIYGDDGRCLGRRRLRASELDLLDGRYCAQIPVAVTGGDAS